MKQRVILSPATIEDVDFIVDIKTDANLWKYDDISPDKDAVRQNVVERINGNWYKQYIIQLNIPESTPVGALHIHSGKANGLISSFTVFLIANFEK